MTSFEEGQAAALEWLLQAATLQELVLLEAWRQSKTRRCPVWSDPVLLGSLLAIGRAQPVDAVAARQFWERVLGPQAERVGDPQFLTGWGERAAAFWAALGRMKTEWQRRR